MAKQRTNAVGKKPVVSGIDKLRSAIEKLQRSLPLGNRSFHKPPTTSSYHEEFEDYNANESFQNVPEDVKEGHFAVIAVHGEEPQRFVLPLSCLNQPRFVRLLEKAAEEYGFYHEGALAIPCGPAELERILAEHNNMQRQANSCGRGARQDSVVDGHHNWGWFM